MNFEALQTRVNASVIARLSNADVVVGTSTLRGIFKNESVELFIGNTPHMGRQPIIHLADSDVSANLIVKGSAMTINGTAYKARVPEPDGTGLTRFQLDLV